MRMITAFTLGILVTLFALSAVADGNKGKAENKSADRPPQVHVDGTDQADESGNAKALEMRERRDERKEIQQEYRDSGEKQSGKKPWWEFWDEDET